MQWQTLIVCAVFLAALLHAVLRVVRTVRRALTTNKCAGCTAACPLKMLKKDKRKFAG